MLSLVKKDFIIVKKLTFMTMGIIVLIPLVVSLIAPTISGIFTLLFMVLIGTLMLLQAISSEEEKYPKAAALICSAPYSRNSYVIAKYLVFIITFAYYYIVDTLVKVILNQGALLDISSVLLVLLSGIIVFCIYMPVDFKYGAVKARYLFAAFVIMFSMGPVVIPKLFPNITLDLSFLEKLPSVAMPVILGAASVIIFVASLTISIKIFSNKEL